MLFHVYDDPKPDGYYLFQPEGFYRTLLEADWILYILLPLLAVIIVAVLMVAWHLHELPQHKAHHKKMRQAELVTALTILGLFMHWVWAVALFFAYVDWEVLEDGLVRVLRRARFQDDAQQGLPDVTSAESAHTSKIEPLLNAPAADPAIVTKPEEKI